MYSIKMTTLQWNRNHWNATISLSRARGSSSSNQEMRNYMCKIMRLYVFDTRTLGMRSTLCIPKNWNDAMIQLNGFSYISNWFWVLDSRLFFHVINIHIPFLYALSCTKLLLKCVYTTYSTQTIFFFFFFGPNTQKKNCSQNHSN